MKPTLLIAALLCAGSSMNAADFKTDDNGYIRNWLLLQPFALGDKAGEHEEGSQKEFFTKEHFEGQFKAMPKAGDKVTIAGKGEKAWKEGRTDDAMLMLDSEENSMYLAVVYVTSPVEVPEAVLSIGSDDSSSWRVNGTEVLSVYAGRAVEPDQDKSRPFTLQKGVNVIQAAVINGGGDVGLSARLLDKGGKPIKDVVISLTPPAK